MPLPRQGSLRLRAPHPPSAVDPALIHGSGQGGTPPDKTPCVRALKLTVQIFRLSNVTITSSVPAQPCIQDAT